MHDPAPPETAAPRKRWGRRLLAGAAALLAALGGAAYWLSATDRGLSTAAGWAEGPLAAALGGTARIEGVSGSLWDRLTVARIALQGADGLDVAVEDLRLAWTPSALLDGRLAIRELGARQVDLTLPQAATESPEESTPPSLALPRLPVAIAIDQLDFPAIALTLDPDTRFAASLQGSARATETGALETTLTLDATQNGAPADRLQVTASLDGGTPPQLALEVAAALPPDGLVAGLIDLPAELRRATALSLAGTGPIDDWRGRLELEAEGLARLAGEVTLSDPLGRSPGAGFSGTAALLDAAALGLPAALTGDAAITLDARLDDGERLTLRHLTVERPGLADLSASGALALDSGRGNAAIDFRLGPDAAALIDSSLGLASAEGSATLEGDLAMPTVTARLSATGVEGGGGSAETLTLEATATPGADGALALDAAVGLAGARWPDPALDDLLGPTADITMTATLSPAMDRLSGLDLRLAPLGLSVAGDLAFADGTLESPALTLRLADLGRLAPLLEQPAAGAATIDFAALRVFESGAVETRFAAGLERFALPDLGPKVARLIGPAPGAEGRLRLAPDGTLDVTLARARAAAGTLTGEVRLSDGFARLGGTLSAEIETAALPLPPDVAIEARTLRLEARLDGPVEAPAVALESRPIDLRLAGEALTAARIEADLSWEADQPEIALAVRAAYRDQPIALDGRVRPEADRLALDAVTLESDFLRASGSLALPGYALPAEGRIELDAARLGPAGELLALPGLAGALTATVDLMPGDGSGAQAATYRVRATDLAFGGADPLSAGTLTIEGRIGDALALSGLDAAIALQDGAAGPARIERLDAALSGGLAALDARLDFAGTLAMPAAKGGSVPISVDGSGRASGLDGERQTLTLDRLDGRLGEITLALAEPAAFTRGAGGLESAHLRATLAGGRLAFDLGREEETHRFDLSLEDLPTAPFLALQGVDGVAATLNAEMHLVEPAGEPTRGRLTAGLSELALTGIDTPEELSLEARAELSAGRVAARLTGAGPGLDEVALDLEGPLDLSLAARQLTMQGDAPVAGTGRLRVDLARIWPYVPAPEHALAGGLHADAEIAGTLAAPRITGEIALDGARYEHLEFGTILRDIAGRIGFEEDAIVVRELTARDTEDGTLTASGRAQLADPIAGARAQVRLANLTLVHTDPIRLTADAELTLDEGAARGGATPTLTGTLTLRRGEVNLGAALPPSTPSLDPVAADAEDREAETAKAGPAVGLDLTVSIPGQLFVRGRGVDSEWQGDLQVTGTSAEPQITGLLTARRGRFDVIGKSFALEESTIRFPGGEEIDPLLGIRGVYETDDLTVIARLAGRASDPEILLESQPPLPRDEILSRVLFGKSKGRLTALEAAQLAASAAELSGGGGGLDVLGTIRRFVGADVLQVDAGENGAQVKAGKYIADGVYVGAKQGASPGSTSVEVEVEVTPNISVNTETGQADSNVGVQFKWDY